MTSTFLLEGQPIKKFGSQGQQKTFLVALKFAQFEFLKTQIGGAPILLLDDAFDKLDQKRVTQIVSLVEKNDFGQIFITDTHEERTLEALGKANLIIKFLNFEEFFSLFFMRLIFKL